MVVSLRQVFPQPTMVLKYEYGVCFIGDFS
jgi:hypothetical protein